MNPHVRKKASEPSDARCPDVLQVWLQHAAPLVSLKSLQKNTKRREVDAVRWVLSAEAVATSCKSTAPASLRFRILGFWETSCSSRLTNAQAPSGAFRLQPDLDMPTSLSRLSFPDSAGLSSLLQLSCRPRPLQPLRIQLHTRG